MKKLLLAACVILGSWEATAQSFEITGVQETYRGIVGQTVRVPVHIRNITDKQLQVIVRKIESDIGSTQKNFFCFDKNCLGAETESYTVKIEPNQSSSLLEIALETGLAPGVSNIRFVASNKAHPNEAFEFTLNFTIDDRMHRPAIYSSRFIELHDLYPNPASEVAFVDYKVLDETIKAKIVLHNILGNPVDEYQLPNADTRVKIKAESFSPGIYFFTLYVNDEGLVTRKLIIRKD